MTSINNCLGGGGGGGWIYYWFSDASYKLQRFYDKSKLK